MAVLMSEYKALFSILMEKSGLTKDEVERRLNEKIESLGHLVNEDVALRLVARDLGIYLNGESKKPTVLITDIVPNMNNVNLELTIEAIGPLKEFPKKDGSTGSLVRAVVSDVSGKSSLVAWDEQASIVEKMKNGSRISVRSAYTKNGLRGDTEIHLGNRSRVEVLNAPAPGDNVSSEVVLKGQYALAYELLEN
jgi:replication factor A1